MSLHPDTARLVAILGDPAAARHLTEAQWSALIATARAANLLGALGVCLEEAGFSAGPRPGRHLDGARQLSARQHQSVLWEVHCIQAALGELQIPVLLLKGAAYVLSDYGIGKGRLFGDIDILVPRAALEEVESRLMLKGWVSAKSSAYDQRYYRKWMHELPPMSHIHRGTVLDVHHTILPLTARNAPDPFQLINRSTPVLVPGLSALRLPCPEDLVIHSITHLVHEGELHNGLRDLNDINGMLHRFGRVPGFWDRLAGYAAGNDLAGPVCFGLHLVRLFFNTPIPEPVLAKLSSNGQARQSAPWTEAVFARALQPEDGGRLDIATGLAQWLVYVRAHALRMPLHLAVPHLLRKAWMKRFSEHKSETPN